MALAENAVYEAVNAITSRGPRDRLDLGPAAGASIDAAVAAASDAVLLHEAPTLKAQPRPLRKITPRRAGRRCADARCQLRVRAAEDVLAKHTDGLGNPEPYRPVTAVVRNNSIRRLIRLRD
jgi:hypothetical protein